ncbi:MAG: hypothetical protein ACI8WB_003544 [Phenylobacterium sp.]|jgi:hypothetical protein
MAFISQKQQLFTYFAEQLGEYDWHDKSVLDFGGNIGNILLDPRSTIEHSRYWCIDPVKAAMEQGRETYPDAHWVFYNRHSPFFNPEGVVDLHIPQVNRKFDYIVVYSVFTNIKRAEMLDLVDQLMGMLAPGGKLAFTFIDPHHHSWPQDYQGCNLQWRLEKDNPEGDIEGLLAKARSAQWFTLLNSRELHIESEDIELTPAQLKQTYFSYYSADYMQSLYPSATILAPANNEMQHCCVIEAPLP